MDDLEHSTPTDFKYEPYGEPEDWTWEGMKVYYYGWKFNQNLDFIETFCTEDGRDWINITPRDKWTDKMYKLAAKGNYI